MTSTSTETTPDPDAGTPDIADHDAHGGSTGNGPGRSFRFGPITPLRLVVLLIAVSFLAGAVGFAIAERGSDPLSTTDVGFMQDMGYHHEQAVQMSILLIDKDDVDPDLKDYAMEILVGQRYEMGLMNGIVDRFGYSFEPDQVAMEWMGAPLPLDEMEGLASDAEMAELRDAEGADAEALWLSLMSEHHLGGLHMADWEARHGGDETTRNIARAMVYTQRGEVIDLQRYRTSHDLPLAEGFSDPLKDQRLNPLSFTGR